MYQPPNQRSINTTPPTLIFTAMFYQFKGFVPVVHPTAFVHPQASVTGNVVIGKHCYIGPGAALRGDWGAVILEDGCNVQENCTMHMFPGKEVRLCAGAHIGHGAVIHGAYIGPNSLVGMNAVVMDGVVLEQECIVGAMSFVKEGMKVPARSLLAGNPATIVKEVSDAMLAWKTIGTQLYQALPADMHAHWAPCTPLSEVPAQQPPQEALYDTWKTLQANAKK